jgi:uncharacterized protein (TIGR03437 family)
VRTVILWLSLSIAVSAFPLGFDYSAILGGIDPPVASVADSSGALYILTASGTLMKLSPDGAKIVFSIALGLQPEAISVDNVGGVYVGAGSFVLKLDANSGSTIYKFPVTADCVVYGVAVDGRGRVYATGQTNLDPLQTTANAFQRSAVAGFSHAFAVRLNSAGTGYDYATYLAGSNEETGWSIAVDGNGSAFVAGLTGSADFPTTAGAYNRTPPATSSLQIPFLTRLSTDGSSAIYSTFTGSNQTDWIWPVLVAVAPDDNAVVYETSAGGPPILMQINALGTAAGFSKTFPSAGITFGSIAVDGAGDIYVVGSTQTANLDVKNSLFTCSTNSYFLTVLDESGDTLQLTYIAPTEFLGFSGAIAIGPNGTVFVAGLAGTGFTPSSQIAGATAGTLFVALLSSASPAKPVPLACIGNGGSFATGTIAAGEIISLFGQGLGPTQGVTAIVGNGDSFPSQLSEVQVTFDGVPAPLIYAQEGQINAIAPWSLAASGTTNVCASYAGFNTNCINMPLAVAVPGVFTSDGVHALAINQDGTINSAANPAAYGSVVAIFATGLGPVTPSPTDGSILVPPLGQNTLPVDMVYTYGGIIFDFGSEETLYAGPAPFEVAGVSQINFQVTDKAMFVSVGGDYYNSIARSLYFEIY